METPNKAHPPRACEVQLEACDIQEKAARVALNVWQCLVHDFAFQLASSGAQLSYGTGRCGLAIHEYVRIRNERNQKLKLSPNAKLVNV